MKKLYIDLETYSSVDLIKSGVYRYAQSPDFEILMAAYAAEDDVLVGDVHVAVGEDEIRAIPGLWDDDTMIVAHNANFERVCLSAFAGMPAGEYLPRWRFDDTMPRAAEWGYPSSLDQLAKALGAEEKDSAGTRLINLFSKPNRKGERTLPEEKPEQWQQFVEYCRQDVATLIDIDDRLPGWPTPTERAMWELDQKINDTGIQIDTDMADQAIAAAEENQEHQRQEIIDISGVENPGSVVQLGDWLGSQGVQAPDLKKATVEDLLRGDLPDDVRRVLELRQELALVASKKYIAAEQRVNEDDRLRGSFQFFGAHTGRWAGRGVQLQNLPGAQLPDDLAVDMAITDLALGNGADAETLKALVRALFVGPFTVVDFSAIEARVIAWLAGEQWALDAFTAGRDIYVETAGRMFGVDEEEALARRKQGKVAVLALGFNGGINSLRVMGAEGDDMALQYLVRQWREANENIVSFWQALDNAFRRGGPVGEHIRIEKLGNDRLLYLPSGRAICYRKVGQRWTEKWGKRVKEVTFADPKRAGARVPTYGGKLAENVTQAVARDLLVEAMLQLDEAGHRVVGHVHDEILVEGASETSVAEVTALMAKNPAWAAGLPLAAEGDVCDRYRKV